jgi:hypothetical protein
MSGLTMEQQKQLAELLEILVLRLGLSKRVLPGYRRLPEGDSKAER